MTAPTWTVDGFRIASVKEIELPISGSGFVLDTTPVRLAASQPVASGTALPLNAPGTPPSPDSPRTAPPATAPAGSSRALRSRGS